MRHSDLLTIVVVLCALSVSGAPVGGTATYDITLQDRTDVPDRTVTHEGETYTISSVGTVGPGEELAVDATVPEDRSHSVNLYEDDSGIEVAFSSGTGSQTHIFDESEVDDIGMGTYAVAVVDGGDIEALTLAVIEGYDLTADAPDQATVGESPVITIDLEETRADGPPDNVEVGFETNGEELRVEAEAVADGTYEATIPTQELGTGTYETIAVATDEDGDLMDEEILGLTSVGDIEIVEPDASVSVETGDATDVDETTATLQGSLTELDGAESATVGFEYGPAGEEFPNEVTAGERDSTGEFDAAVDGLAANTTYEFRAVGDAEDAAATGEAVTFTTPESDDEGSLSVETDSATEVDEESAMLSGELTAIDGTSEATVYFEYGPEDEGFTEQTGSETLDEPGSFEMSIDGLEPGTGYEFRAVAEIENQTDTGATASFTTDDTGDGPIGGGPPGGSDDDEDEDSDEETGDDDASDDGSDADQSDDDDAGEEEGSDDGAVQQPTDDSSETVDESDSEAVDDEVSDEGLPLSLAVPVFAVVLLAVIAARRSH